MRQRISTPAGLPLAGFSRGEIMIWVSLIVASIHPALAGNPRNASEYFMQSGRRADWKSAIGSARGTRFGPAGLCCRKSLACASQPTWKSALRGEKRIECVTLDVEVFFE